MSSASLKDLYDRKVRVMSRRPAFGRSSGQARAWLKEGLVCHVEQKDRTTIVDQPSEEGGTGRGPHPGQLMRASLAACLAQGYRIWGARLGVSLEEIEVDLVCEYDARGQMGFAEVPVGWQRITCDVRIRSSAPLPEIQGVVETANRLSPMLANLSAAIEKVHKLTVTAVPGVPAAARTRG